MAVTLATATKNAMLNAINTALSTSAKAVFKTAGGSEIATCALYTSSAFAAASGGSMVMNAATEDSSANAGTITSCELQTSGSTTVLTLSVSEAEGSGDIKGGNVCASGDAFRFTGLTLSVA